MKKKLLGLLLILCVVALDAHAQNTTNAQTLEVVHKPYGSGYSMIVIKPTIDNFIKLVNMSELQFVQTMRNYQYFSTDDDGKYVSYWNGSIDNFAYAKCVNTFLYNIMRKEIRCFVPMDMIYPQGIIQDLYRTLRQYHVASAQSIDKFSFNYNGSIYEFYITTQATSYDIQVLKK